ncbi:hypothetical protein OIDMADRAFT_183280 [Oidiodendron maius Zn]|uniref:Uncharacterized protein n=1 Tax=Oidiodendron maius (strain Zn) TaxID=913774 RepID=A0A0C3H1Y9_OIDMZ|nr:hypothetical protein OIDMADRAFT_183280 [Oidiodendron maius Zn]
MQFTMKECTLLAFIFFTSPAVGTMVNGAPVPIDARNEINRIQAPNAGIQQRAAASSAAAQSNSGGGGLLGMIGQLAPFAEDLLPMIGLRDLETRDTPDAAAAAHGKAVEELKSKLINDPSARQKLYHIITKVSGAAATPAIVQRAAATTPASNSNSNSNSGGGGLLGMIGQLAPFAEDLLPLIGLRDLDGIQARSPADAAAASHEQAVEKLKSKLINDPSARQKLYHIITKVSGAAATPAIVQRAAATTPASNSNSNSNSGGGGLLGMIGQLAPFAEDLLPLIGL